jgi:hypothetical protein
MVLTRSEAKTAYTHILQNVFGTADGKKVKTTMKLKQEHINQNGTSWALQGKKIIKN